MSFTTTACNRPNIIERTYDSFCNNVLGIDFHDITLYINIDPAPKSDNREVIIEIAKKYFGNVVVNLPRRSNFTI